MTLLRHPAPALALALLACGKKEAPPPPPTPSVGYVVLATQDVTLTNELPGRTAAYESSDVRPQVNGLVQARLFAEGDRVVQGQPLYRIDSQPYVAQVASANAALARARAAIASSAALARRYGQLVAINAIARQDYENALTSAAQARADVAAQQAALRSAQIDLARTTIRAPITGRIGRSTFTTGALVTAAQTEPLATIQRLDPIYVDIQQASADLLQLRRQILAGQVARDGNARARLMLEDGAPYGAEGTLRFADVTVDQTTGTQVIRAIFPNPQGLLLPGMYVRARLVEGTQQRGILVPQRAVGRDERGNATVMVIGPDNKVSPRVLQTDRVIGDSWLVTGGVRPGDRVVVEGGMALRPGAVVKPVRWQPGQRPARAPGGQPGGGGAPAPSQAQGG